MRQLKTICRKYGVPLFFLIFFLYGMAVVKDYGISWDESTERESSLINLGYIMPQATELVTDTVNYYGLPPLHDYYLRYYGVAGQFPAILAEYLYRFRFNYQQIYLMRHMYTFAVFWVSTVFFYLICKQFTGRRKLGLLGVFMLISSPRILADSFYNIKDLLFLSFFVITLYYGLLLLRKQTWPRLLLFGFFGGLCTNTRIVGAIPVACCVLILGWNAFCSRNRDFTDRNLLQKLLFSAGAGFFSLLFYLLFTPVVWQNPVEGILGIIRTFSSYVNYVQSIFYMGAYPMSDRLPWHYLPVWILATTPVVYLLLMAAGICFQIQSLAKYFVNNSHSMRQPAIIDSTGHTEKLFLCLNAAIPLLYVFFFRPVLYNGWRHFYFIYPILVLAALYGYIRLVNLLHRSHNRQGGKIAAALLIAGTLPVLSWIWQNHPFEYLYFNPIARPFAEDCFEKDYWGVSQLDALQYICRKDSRETIRVWTMTPSENRYFLSYEDQARIEIVGDLSVADYAICNHTSTRSTEAISQMSLYNPDYVKEIDGMAVYTVFRRDYTPYFCSGLKERHPSDSPAAVTTEVSGIRWTADIDGPTSCFTGQLSETVRTGRIRLETGDRDSFSYTPGELELSFSEDGIHWTDAPVLFREDPRYDYDFHCVFPEMNLNYIRLTRHAPSDSGKADLESSSALWEIEVQVLAPRSDFVDHHRDSVIRSATASHLPEEAPFAFDRNLDTRWTSGAVQEAGMYFELELEQTFTLDQIVLVQAGYRSDFPAALEIAYSTDGETWKNLDFQSEDMETFRFSPTAMKWIRFRIPDETAEAETNWSVYEIRFYRSILPEQF